MTTLEELEALATKLIDAQEVLAKCEQALADAKLRVAVLSEDLIPMAMENVGDFGIKEFVTNSGFRIKTGSKIRFNTKSPILHQWLRDIGNAGIIKSNVIVPFKKAGSDAEARELQEQLTTEGYAATFEQAVAWNSMESLIKRMREDGKEVPELKSIDGFEVKTTQVEMPK
tara:strand:- start:4435 stop:4947 length:513 start_codon:yes stop_codon:yes gene_type:complete